MRQLISKILNKILSWYNPQAARLSKSQYFNLSYVSLISAYSKVSTKAKCHGPYRIIESEIDDYTYIAEGSMVFLTSIGKFCSIGPNFLSGYGIHPLNGISTHPMFYSTLKQNGMTLSKVDKVVERKKIKIGNDVFIGANVTILDGVTIGDGAVIGAGAVVTSDIEPYSVVGGVPAKLIKYRFSSDIINHLLKIEWWNWEDERLKEVEEMFWDVNLFVKKYSNNAS
jgi:acetyltransferase-like isoleucine patch superfamily enzyme